jgi:uncharacterized protein YuzE
MKFRYDHETDSLYIDFIDGAGVDNVMVTDDIVADIDAEGRLIGLDIQHASQKSDLSKLSLQGISPTVVVEKN